MASELRRVENRLAEITEEMRTGEHRKNEQLLSALTNLAAELEAGAAANLYRFGASRAYYEIVEERLNTLSETPVRATTPGLIFATAHCPSHANLPRFCERTTGEAV